MNHPSQRSAFLRAAEDLVRDRGAAALTLDSVAARSGASKGGILYHFPTKAALVGALIDSEIEAFESAIDRALASEKSGRGAYARAYARATVEGVALAGAGLAGVLAAVANDESVLETYRAKTAQWRSRMIEDGLDQAIADLIRLAADGLYYSAAIGAALPSASELDALFEVILALAKEGRV
jgi:AcrR family transcriptional regulator